MDEFCDAVIKQIGFFGKDEERAVDTVYLGGGTPSLLGPNRLSRILNAVRAAFNLRNPEITLEANPADNLYEIFLAAKNAGVNRISFGVQSAIETELKALGRRHTNNQVQKAVQDAKNAGINNISLDLMIGIPYQTKSSLKESIKFLTSLNPNHISAYILKVEDGTPIAKSGYTFADDDFSSALYLDAVNLLDKAGFKQYEISNFAKDGNFSRHNLRYWQLKDYIGVGPSAHSFYKGKRFFCKPNLSEFLNNPTYLPDGDGGGIEEYVMLMLRTVEGINFNTLKTTYGVKTNSLLPLLKKLSLAGLGILNDADFHLTPKGFLLSNSIITQVLSALEENL